MVNVNNQSPGLKALSHQYPEMDIGRVPPCSMLPLAHQVGIRAFHKRDIGAVLSPGKTGRELSVRLHSLVWLCRFSLVSF